MGFMDDIFGDITSGVNEAGDLASSAWDDAQHAGVLADVVYGTAAATGVAEGGAVLEGAAAGGGNAGILAAAPQAAGAALGGAAQGAIASSSLETPAADTVALTSTDPKEQKEAKTIGTIGGAELAIAGGAAGAAAASAGAAGDAATYEVPNTPNPDVAATDTVGTENPDLAPSTPQETTDAQMRGFSTPEQQKAQMQGFKTPEQLAGEDPKTKILKGVSKGANALKAAGDAQSKMREQQAATEAASNQAMPTLGPSQMMALPQGPSIAGESLIKPSAFGGSDLYGSVFGEHPAAPSRFSFAAPKPPPMIQPPPMMSDRNQKTNVVSARRPIEEFLAQVRVVNA